MLTFNRSWQPLFLKDINFPPFSEDRHYRNLKKILLILGLISTYLNILLSELKREVYLIELKAVSTFSRDTPGLGQQQ